VRYYALWLSLLLQGMQGEASPELLQTLWELDPNPHLLAYDLPLLVRLCKGHPSLQTLVARRLRAAKAQPPSQALPQALLLLAEGLYRFPKPEARRFLEQSLPTLEAERAEEALMAQSHLCALEGTPLPAPYRQMAQALRPEARAVFLPAELPPISLNTPYLQTLGKAQLQGYPALRPRSLELLTLLLAHPEGIEGEKLAQELYPTPNPLALRSELCRLRQQGIEVQSRPYRLLSPIEADFLQLQEAPRTKPALPSPGPLPGPPPAQKPGPRHRALAPPPRGAAKRSRAATARPRAALPPGPANPGRPHPLGGPPASPFPTRPPPPCGAGLGQETQRPVPLASPRAMGGSPPKQR